MLFKICGLKSIKTIKCCIKNKANFYGLVFHKKSSRDISFSKALNLVNFSRNRNINPVGVFVDKEINFVNSMIDSLKLDYVQLHGNENNKYILDIKKNFNIKIIKSISVSSIKDLGKIEEYKESDFILLDYKPKIEEQPGGNAKTFDWKILNNFKINKPWFISGGINESNIRKIKKYANPDGIDLSSGVEELPGIKSDVMINSLFKTYYG